MTQARLIIALMAVAASFLHQHAAPIGPLVPAAMPITPEDLGPSPVEHEPITVPGAQSTVLCGARLPEGYHLIRGFPTRSGSQFHPQDIGLFFQQVLGSGRYTVAQKRCILTSTATATLLRATRRGKTLLFPYSFGQNYGRAGTIDAPWFSGLAQATLMGSLRSIAHLTAESRFDKAAAKTYGSFFLPPSDGGFVMDLAGDASWIQEYPTPIPSFVLNGHMFSILAVRSFADASRDSRGRDLFVRGIRAIKQLLPLFDMPGPGGNRSAYDLIRRYPAAPLRLTGALNVERFQIIGKGGRVHATLASRTGDVTPAYPISVRDVPRVFARVAYRGSGTLAVRDGRSWLTLASLPAAQSSRTITVEIPQRLQGRSDAGRYHSIHIDLLRRIARATGDASFATWANRWDG